MTEIYHGPSRNTHGAHVIRYYSGRITICTGFDAASRAAALSMLTPFERKALQGMLGEEALAEWVTADEVGPRQVPEAMRLPGFSYNEDYWITPIPEFDHLNAGYPFETPR